MKISKSVLLVTAAAGLAAPLTAQTALTQTQSTTAAQSLTTQSLSRNGVGTSTFAGPTNTAGSALIPLSRFDTNTGILVGARFTVNVPYTVSLSALGTVPASGDGRKVDVTGTVTGSVVLANTAITTVGLTASPKCFAGDCGNLSKNNTDSASGTLTGNASVTGANLALLAGAGPGTVNMSTRVSTSNVTVTNDTAVTTGTAFSQFQLGSATQASNQYSVTYDYLNFSTPSFTPVTQQTTASATFGTVFRNTGGGALTQSFNITNIAAAPTNTSPTSLTGVTADPGNVGVTNTLTSLSNLGGGQTSTAYTVGINTTTTGTKSGTFTYAMTDTPTIGGVAVAGAVGMRTTNLTYTVSGTVVDRAAPSLSASAPVASTTLDFGNVYRNAGVVSGTQVLANLGGTAAVNAVVTGVATTGGYTTSLVNGQQVAPFSPQNFNVSFNANSGASGARNGSAVISLSDVITGMANGTTANNYTLTVNTTATVWDNSNVQIAATQPLNLGTVFAGNTASGTFALTNIGALGTNRVAGSVTSVNTTGAGEFSTNLVSLSSLAANAISGNYNVSLNSLTAGQKTGSFVLNVADVAPNGGITGTGATYTQTLNVVANVINHANPSFSGSSIVTSDTLDFGTVSSRGGPVLRNFSLFNIGDANSAGLELYQINGPNNSLFTSNITPFLNLAGGASNSYQVTLNPLNLGAANGVYTFLFRDYAPGVAGRNNYTLTLNVLANVFDPVPEPASWMSMIVGFGLVGAFARRRKAIRAR